MSSENIYGLLADCQADEAYEKASADNWTPPPGDYNVLTDGVDARSYTKNGQKNGVLVIKMQILDGDYSGKSFELPLFQTNQAHGSVMKSLIGLLGGEPVGKFASDAQVIADELARKPAFLLSCKQTPNKKKPGEFFTNWKFVNELPNSPATVS